MKLIQRTLLTIMLCTTGACSVFQPATFAAGTPEDEVIAKLGQPTHSYQNDNQEILEYNNNSWGQQTYMARFSSDKRLISYEQVLTAEKFATIKTGVTTKDQVLRTIGAPAETSYLPLRDLEVWSYPYKESNVWNSIMHVHFDKAGVVQQMLNGPDPRFDSDRHGLGFGWGHGRR
jgi:hypothetical protein